MSRDFQKTHENLLNCAKQHFLEFGFERASIRQICKDANVTNGAFYNHFKDKEALFGELVEPIVQGVSEMYGESVENHFELAKTEELTELWKLTESTVIQIIEYVYVNFDVFKLLLMRSEGTKYATFLNDVVCYDVNEMQRLIAEIKKRGIVVNDLEEDEWHMLVHAYYSSIAEIVLHNYPKTVALKYVHTVSNFFSSGWLKVLGI
jgi:AcrR family transcriptional regulator